MSTQEKKTADKKETPAPVKAEESKKPQTAKDDKKPRHQNNKNKKDGPKNTPADKNSQADNKNQTNNKNKGPAQRREQDKDSWVYKFHHMDRPKWDRQTINAETEIPALPTKEERLKNPTKPDFERDMQRLDDRITQVRE